VIDIDIDGHVAVLLLLQVHISFETKELGLYRAWLFIINIDIFIDSTMYIYMYDLDLDAISKRVT